MAKDWTDDEVRKEIGDAIAIVREDRFEAFVRSNHTASNDQGNQNPTGGNSGNDSGNGNSDTKKKGALWWGVDPTE